MFSNEENILCPTRSVPLFTPSTTICHLSNFFSFILWLLHQFFSFKTLVTLNGKKNGHVAGREHKMEQPCWDTGFYLFTFL